MTTDEATLELAKLWAFGGFDEAGLAIDRCKAQSRNWNWKAANVAMRDAYLALGATPPEVAVNAIHIGNHPVQDAAENLIAG